MTDPHPRNTEGFFRIPDRPGNGYPGYTSLLRHNREIVAMGYGPDVDVMLIAWMEEGS